MKKTLLRSITVLSLLLVISNIAPQAVSAAPYDAENQDFSALWAYQVSSLVQRIDQAQQHSLKGKVIVLDPGHGGSDTGAIGPNNVTEKKVTLAIADDLRKLLTNGGAKVIMTRASDRDVAYAGASPTDELQARVNIANQAKADLFISIHADSSEQSAVGTTTYFYPSSSDALARSVQSNLVTQLKSYDRGFQPNDFFVLKYTNMPAILTEAAFISNPQEERLLQTPAFDKKVAVGLYNGIKNYFLSQ